MNTFLSYISIKVQNNHYLFKDYFDHFLIRFTSNNAHFIIHLLLIYLNKYIFLKESNYLRVKDRNYF